MNPAYIPLICMIFIMIGFAVKMDEKSNDGGDNDGQ